MIKLTCKRRNGKTFVRQFKDTNELADWWASVEFRFSLPNFKYELNKRQRMSLLNKLGAMYNKGKY